VSFFLALLVALKARKIEAPLREEVYSEVIKRFKDKPQSFFLPPPEAPLERGT
jgi:site-specific recombinase